MGPQKELYLPDPVAFGIKIRDIPSGEKGLEVLCHRAIIGSIVEGDTPNLESCM